MIGVLFLFPALALAALQVFPTRVLLTQKKRATYITLRHVGKAPERYKIGLEFFRMKDDGSLELTEKPKDEERPATSLIMFSPKEVLLQPHQDQVVRVMAMALKPLVDGEYRAHIHFDPQGDGDDIKIESKGLGAKGVGMAIAARISVSIPIVYRHGEPTIEAQIDKVRLDRSPAGEKKKYSAELKIKGGRFFYGDLKLFSIQPGKPPQLLSQVNGLSSYLESRKISFDVGEQGLPTSGMARLEVWEREDSADLAGKLLTSADLPIN